MGRYFFLSTPIVFVSFFFVVLVCFDSLSLSVLFFHFVLLPNISLFLVSAEDSKDLLRSLTDLKKTKCKRGGR